jgi:hypothetical protein
MKQPTRFRGNEEEEEEDTKVILTVKKFNIHSRRVGTCNNESTLPIPATIVTVANRKHLNRDLSMA